MGIPIRTPVPVGQPLNSAFRVAVEVLVLFSSTREDLALSVFERRFKERGLPAKIAAITAFLSLPPMLYLT